MENAPVAANAMNAGVSQATTPLGVMQSNVSRQPVIKQLLFLVAIAGSIALGAWVFMWSQTPNYQVLFANMAPKEASEVVSVLQSMNTQYKLDPNTGVVLVPASEVQALRMRLAAEGFPRSNSQGMEMLNQDQGFGTSQFIERARYQRALEEELSRSISELVNVRSARVHLAIPKQSVFVRDKKPAKASVVVNLFAGRQLVEGQVAAITHMVSSSVPEMTNADVTIVDQRGHLLTSPERESMMAMSDKQLEYVQKVEKLYIRRIEDILTPIVGLGGVRAQVSAEVDFTMTEQTQESYNPDMAALRSEQVSEEQRVGALGATGIPGALSNTPPAAGVAPENIADLEGGVASQQPGSNSKNSTRNYELDRTISHTRLAPGAVRKLSVAVLVDERRTLDEAGEVISVPLTEGEMTRINALVMDTIGFNKARGDSLNIVNAPFVAPEAVEDLPEVSLLEQPWLMDLVKQVLGGLVVLFLIFGVIRPAFKDMTKVPVTEMTNTEGAQVGADGAPLLPNTQSAGGTPEELAKLATGSEKVEDRLTNVRSLVQQDPALVASVMKNWTASDG
jgi:flagellar M-ring protein FliF